MSKFCGNCGAVMDDAAAVCGNCGTPFAVAAPAAPEVPVAAPVAPVAAPVAPAAAPEAPQAAAKVDVKAIAQGVIGKASAFAKETVNGVKNGDKTSMIKGGAVVAAALVVLILIISMFSGGGEEKLVKKLVKAYDKENAAGIVKILPKFMVEIAEERDQDIEETYEYKIENFYDYMEEELDADGLRFSYKIKDVDEVDEDDLEELADGIKDTIQMLDSDVEFKKSKVKKGCEIDVDVTVKGGGDKDKVDLTVYAIKYGSKWYLVEYEWDY